jgi:ATP phosphoribosyltransferase
MAIPDGHQQRHVVGALADAGLSFAGYDDSTCIRRPASGIDGLDVKVVRPHDMPQLVALGQFDIAITGRDCLLEHLHRFPSSPVQELVDLQRGQYNLSAVVTEDLPADRIEEALAYWRGQGKASIRVASEFMSTADYYARSRHLWRYQVMPIAGASEGFVPEDAELLIEGTETGKTLRENRLKPIDLLYRSTTCAIGRKAAALDGPRKAVFDHLLAALQRAGEAAGSV